MVTSTREASPAVSGSDELKAVLGPGSEFEGKIRFEGSVRIDGKVTGAITTGEMLIVGESAEITAEITCGSIVVHGSVTGNVRASNSIELRPRAKLRGNIETASLVVERGALFEGQTTMGGGAADVAVAAVG